jgi:hypothetical protein
VAFVTQWQSAIEEKLTRLGGDLDELGHGELLQSRARLADAAQVLADDAGIHLADFGADFAGFVVFDLNFIEGLVGAAFAESGEVWDGHED